MSETTSVINPIQGESKGILDKVKGMMPNRPSFLIIIGCILFLCGALYVYKTYVVPKLNPQYVTNSEFVQKPIKTVTIMFFKTEWCPHCKTSKPVWEQIKEKYDGKVHNDFKLIFKEIDCEKEENLCDEYKIEGYPTIKLVKGDEVIEFDAKVTMENFDKFVETVV